MAQGGYPDEAAFDQEPEEMMGAFDNDEHAEHEKRGLDSLEEDLAFAQSVDADAKDEELSARDAEAEAEAAPKMAKPMAGWDVPSGFV